MFLPTHLALPSPSESPALALLSLPTVSSTPGLGLLDHPDDDPARKLGNWSSLIGIVTAIVGNVLIALALNVQRYAHIQLHRRRAVVRERAKQAMRDVGKTKPNGSHNGSRNGGYGTVGLESNGAERRTSDGTTGGGASGPAGDDDARDTDPLTRRYDVEREEEDGDDESKMASTSYLKSPYWWLGQVLITIGEMGNFLAYGFAPASIVSPLGVVALISNCVIAPFLFKEVFRHRDFWGVIIAIAGAVTVVLSAKQEETKLEPHDVWDAITTTAFEVYVAVTCSLIALLMWASPRYGNRTILLDLGLVGLFGGYTVLATKGVSSMLSSTLFGAFTTPVTYALLLVLVGTAIMQVRYVNKALQRFDSTQVIPIQFVLFTLSVIIGSAVLYRDFERTSAEQAVKFVGGCLLTFFGVFLITSGRPRADEEEEERLSDEEGVEETIGLAEQGPAAPHTPQLPQSRRGSESARSRRSSRASRVSFLEAVNKPLTVLSETGVPSLRAPAASSSRSEFGSDGPAGSPMLKESENPWREQVPAGSPPLSQSHPPMTPHALSSESVPTISSVPHALGTSPPATVPLFVESPVTPRAQATLSASRPHSHHFSTPMYSPSPLSSTVSAVVADTLLRHVDSSKARRLTLRRSRPGLRNSLFVPQDELDGDFYVTEALSPGTRDRPRDPNAPLEEEGLLGGGGGDGDDGKRSFRTRARSLSHQISGLFGGKKRRRGTSADTDDGEGGSSRGTPTAAPAGESAAALRSAGSLDTL